MRCKIICICTSLMHPRVGAVERSRPLFIATVSHLHHVWIRVFVCGAFEWESASLTGARRWLRTKAKRVCLRFCVSRRIHHIAISLLVHVTSHRSGLSPVRCVHRAGGLWRDRVSAFQFKSRRCATRCCCGLSVSNRTRRRRRLTCR